jgi:hypothetical protein
MLAKIRAGTSVSGRRDHSPFQIGCVGRKYRRY